MNRRVGGFTLIEVMIAVAIVAILVAVALPAYQEQVRKGKRAEGKTALLQAIQLQERFYTASTNGRYSIDLGPLHGLAGSATVYSGENPAATTGWYILTADTTDCVPADLSACVRVVATPRAGFTDDNCGVLTLNSRGARTAKDNAYCWGG